MDYERINHKVQMGVISPSKLRMKLLGAHNSNKKEGGGHSSRTSPSKLEDTEYAKNRLLTSEQDEEGNMSMWHRVRHVSDTYTPKYAYHNLANSDCQPVANGELLVKDLSSKEKCDANHTKSQVGRGLHYQCQPGGNLSSVYPVTVLSMKQVDEDGIGNGYDSGHDNGSASSFEFHRGERNLHHSSVGGPFNRHLPSKWNDAEKWIVSRQAPHLNASKKNMQQSQGGRPVNSSWMRIASDSMIADKRVDSGNRTSLNAAGKFFFVPNCLNGMGESIDLSRVGDDFASQVTVQKEKDHNQACSQEKSIASTSVVPTVESVSMRDVGTEMTPIPSQDPSRTGTPLGATTPSRSPISSRPSTPKRGPSTEEKDCQSVVGSKKELSEKELKLKTRREIAALGIQLGKKNIASWASKNEPEHSSQSAKTLDTEQHAKADYEARAAAWEEVEKAKHMARYKQEELKIQAWESHQRAKFEAKLRKVEVQVEQMRIHVQEKVAEKLAVTRRHVEERRADAEARKNQRAARAARQAEQIRLTGQTPSSLQRCLSCFL